MKKLIFSSYELSLLPYLKKTIHARNIIVSKKFCPFVAFNYEINN